MNSTPRAPNVATFSFVAGVFPHFSVHGRREQNRRAGRERDCGQRMTGQAVRQLRDDVRRRGRDHEQIGAIRQRDVPGMPALLFHRRSRS